jgi:hypothetical protein
MEFFSRADYEMTNDEYRQSLVKSIVLDGTFFEEGERDATSVTEVTFNRERNRVWVSLEIYKGPKSARGYNLVLSKRNASGRSSGSGLRGLPEQPPLAEEQRNLAKQAFDLP